MLLMCKTVTRFNILEKTSHKIRSQSIDRKQKYRLPKLLPLIQIKNILANT